MATSPTQRTLAALRQRGEVAQVVERFNQFARVRQDLFGFIDIVNLRGNRIVGIQCTSGSAVSARVNKILASEHAPAWLNAGGLIEVWGWRKAGPRGARKLWQPRVVSIGLDDLRSPDKIIATIPVDFPAVDLGATDSHHQQLADLQYQARSEKLSA